MCGNPKGSKKWLERMITPYRAAVLQMTELSLFLPALAYWVDVIRDVLEVKLL
jgi:hypothetical protein